MRNVKAYTVLFVLIIGANPVLTAQKNTNPSILLIMADDIGFSDIGSYGSEIHTPKFDRLAKEGTSLTRFYNNAICAPSWASLLTDQYPHKKMERR